MKSINRGTTPLLRYEHPFEYKNIVTFSISFTQDGEQIFIYNRGDGNLGVLYTMEDNLITIQLDQIVTNEFKHNYPLVTQLKILTTDGEVWAGKIEHYKVHRILDEHLMYLEEDDDIIYL